MGLVPEFARSALSDQFGTLRRSSEIAEPYDYLSRFLILALGFRVCDADLLDDAVPTPKKWALVQTWASSRRRASESGGIAKARINLSCQSLTL